MYVCVSGINRRKNCTRGVDALALENGIADTLLTLPRCVYAYIYIYARTYAMPLYIYIYDVIMVEHI